MLYAPFRFLQPMHPFCQYPLLHICSITAIQVMHQSPQLCIFIPLTCVHVDDMGLVSKIHSRFFYNPFDVQNRKLLAKDIAPGDEDHIRFRQPVKIPTRIQNIGIHQAQMIPGSLGLCSLIILL